MKRHILLRGLLIPHVCFGGACAFVNLLGRWPTEMAQVLSLACLFGQLTLFSIWCALPQASAWLRSLGTLAGLGYFVGVGFSYSPSSSLYIDATWTGVLVPPAMIIVSLRLFPRFYARIATGSFLLRDLLLVTSGAAVCFAAGRILLMAEAERMWTIHAILIWPMIGVDLCVLTAVGLFAAFGKPSLWMRLVFVFGLVVVLAGIQPFFFGALEWDVITAGLGLVGLSCPALVVTASLVAIRGAGYRLCVDTKHIITDRLTICHGSARSA